MDGAARDTRFVGPVASKTCPTPATLTERIHVQHAVSGPKWLHSTFKLFYSPGAKCSIPAGVVHPLCADANDSEDKPDQPADRDSNAPTAVGQIPVPPSRNPAPRPKLHLLKGPTPIMHPSPVLVSTQVYHPQFRRQFACRDLPRVHHQLGFQ